MMFDWNNYPKQTLATIGDIGKIGPDIVHGFTQPGGAHAKAGRLDANTRELLALAVAVTRPCDGCITVHTAAALKQGPTREEIVDALGMAISVNAGAALVYSAPVMEAYSAMTAPPETDSPTG